MSHSKLKILNLSGEDQEIARFHATEDGGLTITARSHNKRLTSALLYALGATPSDIAGYKRETHLVRWTFPAGGVPVVVGALSSLEPVEAAMRLLPFLTDTVRSELKAARLAARAANPSLGYLPPTHHNQDDECEEEEEPDDLDDDE